jgi:peptide/nickel transport system permease protein
MLPILPALTLAIAMTAKYTRQIRAVFLDELSKEYVQAALSRGLSYQFVITRYVLRSVLAPLLALLAVSAGSLLGGAAIIESIFLWDGIGKLAVDAIMMRDYPIIQAYVIWMSLIYVGVNLLSDIVCRFLDPRIAAREKED